MTYKTGYPNRLTKAQVDALTLLTIADFTSTLSYRVAEKSGADLPSDPTALTPAPAIYVMRTVTVKPATINQDLVEFQDWVRRNGAYSLT